MKHRDDKVLPYSPAQMYALVMDIERYPEFLPWCVGARIWQREPDFIMADLLVGYKMLREKFTSRVRFVPDTEIHVEYLDGPLKFLKNDWSFLSEPDGCRVQFHLDFEFRHRLLQGLMEGFFNEAMSCMMDAFVARARVLYEKT